ncbi:IPT/TIG domain-containing protein [Paraflavitalea pollutisoli]|uniref:IPT/TIG domain-containing protein n=1 Tax=Paraflavitalea pollutisoli TaxID=3034143 RepID=UPI0023ECF6DC|nr:IPT/TIG domain-containing protein [Paraflavitalea sp. H1-2-19X]
MKKVLRSYKIEKPVLLLLIVLIALVHSCGKDSANDPPPGPPAPVSPEIISLEPGHAMPGTEITITGKRFHEDRLRNYVYFSGASTEASISAASPTSLKVKVPENAVTGKIIVKVNNLADTSTTDFVVDPVVFTITGFHPKQGPFGTLVTIEGTHFGEDMVVKINNLLTPIKRRTASTIEIEIPVSTTLTAHKLTVTSGTKTLETAEPFTITSAGPYARWESKGVVLSSNGSSLYDGGLSFIYQQKIYWGFTRLHSSNQIATYVVFDPADPGKGWQAQTPPPAQVVPFDWQHGTAIVHHDRIYLGAGITGSGESSRWWTFDPATNTGTALTDFPHAVMKPISFELQDKVYVGFGNDNKKLYRFDPAAANNKGQFTLVTTGPFSDLLWGNAFVLNNEVYLGRALQDMLGTRKAVYKFTAPDRLERMTDMPTDLPTFGTPTFTIGNKGYCVIDKQVWEFTPGAAGGSWRAVVADNSAPSIQHIASLNINGTTTIYGWSATGRLFEFKFN